MVTRITYWLGGPHPKYFEPRQFEDNAAFFQWLCKYGETRMRLQKPMIARVATLDDPTIPAQLGLGFNPLAQEADYQPMKVVIPHRDGYGRPVQAVKIRGWPNLEEGDLVGIVPVQRSKFLGEPWWFSTVVAKMRASTNAHGPVVENYY